MKNPHDRSRIPQHKTRCFGRWVSNLSRNEARIIGVMFGSNEHPYAAIGKQIGEVRFMLEEKLKIPSKAVALIDGRQARDFTVVPENTNAIEFVVPKGITYK